MYAFELMSVVCALPRASVTLCHAMATSAVCLSSQFRRMQLELMTRDGMSLVATASLLHVIVDAALSRVFLWAQLR